MTAWSILFAGAGHSNEGVCERQHLGLFRWFPGPPPPWSPDLHRAGRQLPYSPVWTALEELFLNSAFTFLLQQSTWLSKLFTLLNKYLSFKEAILHSVFKDIYNFYHYVISMNLKLVTLPASLIAIKGCKWKKKDKKLWIFELPLAFIWHNSSPW